MVAETSKLVLFVAGVAGVASVIAYARRCLCREPDVPPRTHPAPPASLPRLRPRRIQYEALRDIYPMRDLSPVRSVDLDPLPAHGRASIYRTTESAERSAREQRRGATETVRARLTAGSLQRLQATYAHSDAYNRVDMSSFVLTDHMTDRMASRGIDIEELERAVKQGSKSAANNGCWRYDFQGVTVVTDETRDQIVGVTCWRHGARDTDVIKIPSRLFGKICGSKHATRLKIEAVCQVRVEVPDKGCAKKFDHVVIEADGPNAKRNVAKAAAVIRWIIGTKHLVSCDLVQAVAGRLEAEARH